MNYRGLHFITICSLICLLSSCSQEKSSVQVCYKQSFPVDTVMTVQEYAVEEDAKLPQLFKLENRLLVFGDYGMMSIYSYPELQLICSQEGPGGASRTIGKGKLYVEKQGKVDAYELENDSLVQTSSFAIANKVPYSIGTVQELRPDVYIYSDMSDFPGMREFHIMNTQKRQCVSKGDYPEDDKRFKKRREFKTAYMHSLWVKPDKSAFVVVYSQLRRVRIYDKEGELCHDIFLENETGNYKVVPKNASERYWHFGQSFVTDRYIYLLNPDKLGIANAEPRCNILVLDWDGNLVAKYKLNVWVYDFFVDEANGIIFGSCWGNLKKDAFFSLIALI